MTIRQQWDDCVKTVISKLSDESIQVQYEVYRAASKSEISAVEGRLGHSIPAQLSELLAEVGNGVVLSWSSRRPELMMGTFPLYDAGCVDIPSLKDMVALARSWLLVHEMIAADIRYRATAQMLREFAPVFACPNGDRFLIRLAAGDSRDGSVFYYQSAWPGEGIDSALHPVADSLMEFLGEWSKVCFFQPRWWPEAFGAPGGVKWKSKVFPRKYRT